MFTPELPWLKVGVRICILFAVIGVVQSGQPCRAAESSYLCFDDHLDVSLLQHEAWEKGPREVKKLLPALSQVAPRNGDVEGTRRKHAVIPLNEPDDEMFLSAVNMQATPRSSHDSKGLNISTSSKSSTRPRTPVESLKQLKPSVIKMPAAKTHSPMFLMLAAVVTAYVYMCGGMGEDEIVSEQNFRCGQYTYLLAPMLTSISSQLLVIKQPYFLMDLGVKGFHLSMVVTASTVGITLGNLGLGFLSDWLKTRKHIFIVSYLLCSIVAQCLSMSRSYQSVAIFSCLNGLVSAIVPVQQAFITDRVKPDDQPRMFTLQQLSTTAGMVVGSWLGIVWVSNLSYQQVCDFKTGTDLINVMLCSLFVKEFTAQEKDSSDQKRPDKDTASVTRFLFYSELTNPVIQCLVLLAALNAIGWPLIESMDAMFFKDVCGFGSHEISILCTVCVAIPLFTCPIVPMVLKRLGALQSITYFSLLGPVLMMPLFIQPNMATAFIKGIGAYSICNITVQIAVATVISERCAEDKKAVVFGLCATAGSLANIISLPVGGALYDNFSPFITYLVGSASMALAGTGYAFLPSPKHEDRPLSRGSCAFKTFAAIGCVACLVLLAFSFSLSWQVKRAHDMS